MAWNRQGESVRILVFQHIAVEHPGTFRDFLAADGVSWDAVELDAGAPIPPLDGYDALWVMGGPMDVWEEDRHPWLGPEKAAIREAVARRMPFLGVCLGHQLLADALGGRVAPGAAPEIGILEIALTPEGVRDPLFAGLAPVAKCLQWHAAEVVAPPAGAVTLAASPACAVQAFRVGDKAYGIQYHVEVTPDTVPEWGALPAYQQALEKALGAGALAGLEAEAARHLPELNRAARRLYDNFMALVRAPAG